MKWLIVLVLVFCIPAVGVAYDTDWGTFAQEEVREDVSEPTKTRDPHRWTATDTVLQLAFTAVLAMDWSQTLYIARNPDTHRERNGLLRAHPSEGRVNAYFASVLVGHAAISILLPKPYRTIWQGAWIAIEIKVVHDNHYEAGIKISLGL